MNALSLLLCPETTPMATDCQPFLLLAETLASYCVLADDRPPAELAPLTAAGLRQGYTPVDLGDHLPRFRQLLQELRGSGNAFSAGALTALTGRDQGHPEEAALWSLITRLRRGKEAAPAAEEELATIWNALLLLKLAEQRLAGEREIAAQLAEVHRKQAALFEELKGDEEFAGQIAALAEEAPPAAPSVDWEKTLRAWGHLFLRDRAEYPMLAVGHKETALLLLDLAAAGDTRPVALCVLPVPAPTGTGLKALHQWRASEADLRARLHALLFTFAHAGKAETAAWESVARQWAEAHRRHFAGQPQRWLTISALPGLSLTALVSRLTKGNKKGHGAFPHGLIAHLTEPA